MVGDAQPREYFRTMDDDPDGGPRCGPDASQLGVRVPDDIQSDPQGYVHPRTGGMSTAADHPRHLPPHFRPRILPGGRSSLPVFGIRDDQLSASISVRLNKKHALVEPASIMQLAAYQATLCQTRPNWRRWI
jgi:hypothetical protein